MFINFPSNFFQHPVGNKEQTVSPKLTFWIFNCHGKYYFLIFENNQFSMIMKWNLVLNIQKLLKIKCFSA
jgi:hypothetical protein